MAFRWRSLVQEALDFLPCVTVEPGPTLRWPSTACAIEAVDACLHAENEGGRMVDRLAEARRPLWVLDESAGLTDATRAALVQGLAGLRSREAPLDVLTSLPLPERWRVALGPSLEAGTLRVMEGGEYRDHRWAGGAFHHPLTRARVPLRLPEGVLEADVLLLTGRVTHDPLLHWRAGYGTFLHRWLAPEALRDLMHPAWTHHPGFRTACHDDHPLQRLFLAMGRTLPDALALMEVPNTSQWSVVGGDAFAPLLQALHEGRWSRWRESDLHDGAIVHVVGPPDRWVEAAMDALLLLAAQEEPPLTDAAPVLLVVRTMEPDDVSTDRLSEPLTSEPALRLREALVARVLSRRLVGVVGPSGTEKRWPGPVSVFDEIRKGLSWLQATADRQAAGESDLLLTRGLHLALPRHRRGRLPSHRTSQ